MDFSQQYLSSLNFRAALWLCPLAFALHVFEEYPRFTLWARRHVNSQFSHRHYRNVHLAGLFGALLVAAILWTWPTSPLTLLCFTFFLTPVFFCNVFFHLGTSVTYRSYSPGLITSLAIYLPLYATLCKFAFSAGLMTRLSWLTSTLIASFFHVVEVHHNVFRYQPTTPSLARTEQSRTLHFTEEP